MSSGDPVQVARDVYTDLLSDLQPAVLAELGAPLSKESFGGAEARRGILAT